MSACISHDGNVVAATTMASEGRAITLWNKSGRVIGRLTQDDVMVNFAFSHNDHYLAATSFGGYVRVWDLSTMGLEAVYEISKAPGLCAVEFSPDDSKIIYSNDSVVEMIEFSSLNELFKQACERFKDRPLTLDERRAFYLE